MKKLALWISMTGLLAFAACDQQGPAEEAGEELDRAAESVEQKAGELQQEANDAMNNRS